MDINNIKTKLKNLIKKASNKGLKASFSNPKISQKQKIEILEQLENLLVSGIPITNSLSIMIYQTKDPKIKSILSNILANLNKGINLKIIVSKFPRIFSQFDISMIEVGEVTGKLPKAIENIKTNEEQSAMLKSKIMGALIYPAVVITMSIGMILTFMLFVIPKIQKMYKDAAVNLPALTQNVINTSDFLQKNIVLIFVGILLFIVLLSHIKTSPYTKLYFDKAILKIPFFGGIIRKKILIMYSNTLGTLLESGVLINKALDIAKSSVDNRYYELEISKIISLISRGKPLSETMGIKLIGTKKDSPYFPIELSSLVKIGEQTGKLPSLLLKISKKYDREIDSVVKNISTVIEPIVIIFVGGIIGVLILAILLPFFNMVNVM